MAFARWVYLASGLIALLGMSLAVRRRTAPGSRWLVPLTAMSALWMFANTLLHTNVSLEARVLWGHLTAVGAFQGSLWLLFALEYCFPGYRVSRPLIALAIGIPVALMGAVFTNPLHHWFWSSITLDPGGSGILIFEHGWLYEAGIYLGMMAFMPGALLFMIAAYRNRGVYRTQSYVLIAAMFVQIITYAVFMLLSDWPLGAYPAMSTGFAMGMVAFAIERLQFLGTIPIGRTELIESMPDGFLVFDLPGYVVDANRAARDILTLPEGRALSEMTLPEMLADWRGHDQITAVGDGPEVTARLDGPAGRHVDARAWSLRDAGGSVIGTALVLRDVTATERARGRLGEATTSVASWVREMNAVEEFIRKSRERI